MRWLLIYRIGHRVYVTCVVSTKRDAVEQLAYHARNNPTLNVHAVRGILL